MRSRGPFSGVASKREPGHASGASANPARILLVRLSHLGDVVHALPIYHALRAAFPAARLGWVVQPEFADLVRALPGLERVLAFDRRGGARAWWRLRAALREFDADLTVDAQGNLKSALATWLTRAPRRVGLHPRDWREPVGARVLTETAAPVAPAHGGRARRRLEAAAGPHAMERMLALARQVAATDGALAGRFDPDLQPAELARGERLATAHLPDPAQTGARRAPVILQLGDPRDVRSWPLARHAALARALDSARVPHVLLSGPDEAEHGARLERELGATEQRRHWVGQRGLRDLAAFFTVCAERGARFVGADSGPLHLAVACGLPAILLAGPQSHRRTGPWPPPEHANNAHVVLRAAASPDCAPCLARRCRHAEGPICLTGLDETRVLQALGADPAHG